MGKAVLVIDDEKSITDAIAYACRREGYEVETGHDGEEALRKVESFRPQVLILDVMMPKMNGYEVCRKLENREGLGIILLTAKNDIVDKVIGLEFGADDYLTKPFDMRELLARLKALLRRIDKSNGEGKQVLALGTVHINLRERAALVEGGSMELTPKEFDLLVVLLTHPERVYTREELLDVVWGMDYFGGTRTVDIHIQRLRKKLGASNQHIIQTVFGVGYKAVGEKP